MIEAILSAIVTGIVSALGTVAAMNVKLEFHKEMIGDLKKKVDSLPCYVPQVCTPVQFSKKRKTA